MEKGHGSAPTVDFDISTGSTTIDTNATPTDAASDFASDSRGSEHKKTSP
jgi:hypothetical protein